MIFGAADIGISDKPVYLTAGFNTGVADVTPIGFRASSYQTASYMRVHHNTPTDEDMTVTYRLRINGKDTNMVVHLQANEQDGENPKDEADLSPGDLIELVVTKEPGLSSAVLNVAVSIKTR